MKLLNNKIKATLFVFLGIISFVALSLFAVNTSSVKATTCPCTIWPTTATPTTPDANDANAVELGVKFTADVDGTISGIRFYKGNTNNSGTHIGNLWTTSGTKLASVTFTGETSSGWQQANFSSPVTITANTTYVASYFAPAGHYAGDNNFFTTSGVDNPPLHALSNGTSVNGVFVYGSDSFPNQTFNATNYWVDVVFQPTPITPTPTPTPPPSSPGTPILVVTSDSNPFTKYYS